MTPNFNSNGAIVLQFPRFAGGKFVGNCLALSRYTCPQNQEIANYLLDHPADYEYRYQSIIKTLPPSQQEMVHWITKYEYGDSQLYGPAHVQWIQTGRPHTELINQITTQLSNSQLHFFLVSHDHPFNLLNVWTNAQVIVLVNHKKFSDVSMKLKTTVGHNLRYYAGNYCKEKYLELKGPDWPVWEQFESAGFDIRNFKCNTHILNEINEYYPRYQSVNNTVRFNVDDCIFDKELFLDSIKSLYEQLGFDDFDAALVGDFWQAYMKLHQ